MLGTKRPSQSSQFASMAWTFHVDGSSNDGSYCTGLVLSSPVPKCLRKEYELRVKFKASNNKAECEALLVGLRLARIVKARHLNIFNDSQLVV